MDLVAFGGSVFLAHGPVTSATTIRKVNGETGLEEWKASPDFIVRSMLPQGNYLFAMGAAGSRLALVLIEPQRGNIEWRYQREPNATAISSFPSSASTLLALQPDQSVVLTVPWSQSSGLPSDIATFRYGLEPSLTGAGTEWVLRKSARLKVNAAGNYESGTVYFEWGTTPQYGQQTPTQLVPAGSLPGKIYTFDLTGLKESIVYYARAVASTSRGTTVSPGFSFTTSGDANANGLPDQWELGIWGNTSPRSAFADEDRDGMGSLVEYAFDRNPRVHDAQGALPIGLDADGRLSMIMTQRPYVSLRPEVSADLKEWSPAEIFQRDDGVLIARDPISREAQPVRRFMRVRVVSQQ